MQIFSEYIHMQFARWKENYFENTKGASYTYFIGVYFMFHGMQLNTNIGGQKAGVLRNNNRLWLRQNISQNPDP